MKEVKIRIKNRDALEGLSCYSVYVGNGILSRIADLFQLERYSKIAFVIEGCVQAYIHEALVKTLSREGVSQFTIFASEEQKNIQTVETLWDFFAASKLDRKAVVVTIGGGCLCDMSGFAASTYMRGIDFIHVPTTLLAQVDASVGGKTGVNFRDVKNLIGAFQQPKGVLIDIDTLATLPERELRSGFSEIIKHALIRDSGLFDRLSAFSELPEGESLLDIIYQSCVIKAKIVEEDEKEIGARKLLNFGHTIGHALESLSHVYSKKILHAGGSKDPLLPLLHGEAVSLGMAAEALLSVEVGMLKHDEYQKIINMLRQYKLPITMRASFEEEEIFSKTAQDKKNRGGVTLWTLLQGIGNSTYDEQVDESIVRKVLKNVVQFVH
jgi:3-dehydroquinate synthase